MSRYRIRSNSLITGFSFTSMFFLGLGVAIVGAAAQNAGIRPEQVGYLLTAQHLGFFVTVAFAGGLADRYSKPVVLAVASLLLALGFAGFYAWESFVLNLAIMLVMGFGIGGYEGVTDALILELHEDRKSLFVNLNHFFVTLGSLVITMYLLLLQMAWRASMVQAAAVVAALGILYSVTRTGTVGGRADRGAVGSSSRNSEAIVVLLRKPALWLLLISMMVAVGVELGTIGILTTYLVELRGFGDVTSKVALLLFLGGFGLGRITLAAVITDKAVEKWVASLFAASVLTTLLLYSLTSPWAIYAMSLLSGVTVSVVLPSIIATGAKRFPDQAGTAIGIIKMGIPVGGMVVPFFVSVLTSAFSLQVGLLLFPAVAGVGLAAFSPLLRQVAEPQS